MRLRLRDSLRTRIHTHQSRCLGRSRSPGLVWARARVRATVRVRARARLRATVRVRARVRVSVRVGRCEGSGSA